MADLDHLDLGPLPSTEEMAGGEERLLLRRIAHLYAQVHPGAADVAVLKQDPPERGGKGWLARIDTGSPSIERSAPTPREAVDLVLLEAMRPDPIAQGLDALEREVWDDHGPVVFLRPYFARAVRIGRAQVVAERDEARRELDALRAELVAVRADAQAVVDHAHTKGLDGLSAVVGRLAARLKGGER